MMELINNAQFTRIFDLYPKSLFNSSTFNISFNQVQTRVRNISTNNHIDQENYDELRMLLVIILKNKIDVSLERNIHIYLKDIDETSIENNVILCDIIVLLAIICKSHLNDLQLVLKDVKESTSGAAQKLKIALALSDLILETCNKYNEDSIKFTISLCIEILMKLEGKQSRSMTIAIIKKLVQFFNYSPFIINLWNNLKSKTEMDDKESLSFDLMCAFSDIYLTPNSPSFECIINESSYWEFVQRGLSSPHALIRKQSMYLLKRTIDTVSLYESALCDVPKAMFSSKNVENKDLNDIWLKYFIVMDSLDEKPAHIVMPALELIQSLRDLQNSWLDILVLKIMNHDTESVKRFGILYALKNTVLDFNNDKERSEIILLHILHALNDIKMFPEENDGRANILPDLSKFLQNIQCNIIEYILKINWSPVPLYYVSFSFNNIETDYSVKNTAMLQKLIQTYISSPNLYIRSAMQINILKYYMKHDTSSLNVNDLPIVLGQFSSQESIGRGTQIWLTIVKWMQTLTLGKQEILSLLDIDHNSTKYNNRQLCRFLILCLEANVITKEEARIILKKTFSYFGSCENRLYTCNTTQCNILDRTNMILIESSALKENYEDNVRKAIVNIISEDINAMMNYVKMKLSLCNSYDHIEIFDKCLTLIKHLLKEEVLRNIVRKNIHLLMDCCLDNLKKDKNEVQKYFSIALLSYFIQYYYAPHNTEDMKFLYYLKESYRSIGTIKDIFNMHLRKNKEKCMVSGRVASSFHKYFCGILSQFVKFKNEEHEIVDIINYIEDVLEYGGKDVVLDVLCILKSLISNSNNDLPLRPVINRCWNESLNLKKSDLFLPCIQAFINVLLQPESFKRNDLSDIIDEYCCKLLELGKGVQGIANMLLQKVFELCNHKYDFTDIIIEGLLFGNILRRDERIENYTCRCIENCGDVELVHHDIEANLEVRALAVASLLKILQYGTEDNAKRALNKVTNFIMQKCVKEDKNKTRYFSDSKHHRFKQRALQTFLFVQPFWDYQQSLEVLYWANESLMQDTHQPSVRYLLEWLVARLILQNIKFIDYLWESMDKVITVRIGAMTSFICIIYLIGQQLTKKDDDLTIRHEFIKKALSKIIPWTMGQHFNLRLYAQVVSRKLLCKADVELKTFQESLSVILSYGNAIKFVDKVENDIFLSDFDVIEHFSLQNIFYTLPKLTKYTGEDIIHVNIFKKIFITAFTNESLVPLFNRGQNLEHASVSAWGINLNNSEDAKDELEAESDNKNYNVQQKITPWKAMDVHDATTDLIVQEVSKSSLIVVASLIDLAPNLGGLARTCEVFGVKEFVIDNLQRVKDKQFQSLSMSAEKWLRISEVKPWELQKYLTEKQSEGYCIVGAEQTAKSHCITKTILPEKCLLLLGNEKEGVPANFLPLLDMCIEIPQKGLIRSLNVHVTGALFVWEYAKQYLVN